MNFKQQFSLKIAFGVCRRLMSLMFILYNQNISHACPAKQVGHTYTAFSNQIVPTQHYGIQKICIHFKWEIKVN